MKKRVYFLGVLLCLVYACKSIPPRIINEGSKEPSKDIVLLIDGTQNTPKDTTNIFKLFKQSIKRNDLTTYYTVGVGGGSDHKITGMAFGVGISKDVREAYQFISKEYNKGDKLYFFGFSRGAFTSQVLTNFIYSTGIIDLSVIAEDKLKKKFVKKLYKAYLGDMTLTERRREINCVIEDWEKENNVKFKIEEDVEIEVLGLFDNVEALAAPDYKEKFCAPNENHLNQLVNVKRVYHAVSLDDNRAQIFTPILSSCTNIKLKPELKLDDVINEVWFSGAHSDVGGGYVDDPEISYVSLNWMISEVDGDNLFDNVDVKDENIFGKVHDSEGSFIGFLYKRRNRDIQLYQYENGTHYNDNKLKVHESVIKRLENGYLPTFKFSKKYKLDWFERELFAKCFEKQNDSVYKFVGCESIEVVKIKN